jgi:hypothetical protein
MFLTRWVRFGRWFPARVSSQVGTGEVASVSELTNLHSG